MYTAFDCAISLVGCYHLPPYAPTPTAGSPPPCVVKKSLDLRKGHVYEIIPGYTKEETEEIYDTMLSVTCIPTKIGTHYQATSNK